MSIVKLARDLTCRVHYAQPGRVQERRRKKRAAAMLAAAPGVRLRCRSGPWRSGRERRGERLARRAAVLADGRKIWAVRYRERRMIEGCLREAHPIVGERLEERHQVRFLGRAEPQVLDAGIQVVDVRLVEITAPGVEVHDLLERGLPAVVEVRAG